MSGIVITGMHRSGTSLLAEILVRAGVHFGPPEQWLPADVSNPRGYFEDRRVVDLDDRLLRASKGTWDEPPPLSPDWLEKREVHALAGEAAAWIESVATTGPWGWKDPRASLVLPFWRRVVPGLRCVLCVRDPVEVGRSLGKRNRMAARKAAFLWLHYLTEAVQGVGDAHFAVFFYEDLLEDPDTDVRRLLRFCGVTTRGAPKACLAVVDPALRRQRRERPAEAGEEPLELCRSVYMHLRALLAGGRGPLPEVRDEALRAGRAALKLLAPSPKERRQLLDVHFSELELAQATIRDLRVAHDHAAALAAEKEREIDTARQAIVERDHRLEASAQALAERSAAQAALAAEKEREINAAREAIVERDHRLGESSRALAERDAAYATLEADLKLAQTTMRDLRLAHDRAAALAREKEHEIDVAREAIVERDHRLEESARALAERNAACATLDAQLQLAQATMRDLRLAHDRAAALAAEKEREIDVAREAIVERDHRLEESARALAALSAAHAAQAMEREREVVAARQAVAERDDRLEEAARTLAERNAAHATLDAERARAQATIRDLELARERATRLAADKEQELVAAREAVTGRDQRLEESLRALAERNAALVLLEDRRNLFEQELTAERQQLATQGGELASLKAQIRTQDAKLRELDLRLSHDERTIKEMGVELAAWQQRRRQVLDLRAARLENAHGFWRGLFVAKGPTRSDGALAGKLLGESRLVAHFDQPSFRDVENGNVTFTGWCLHPAGELIDLCLRLNGVSYPTRFGLDRPDVGAAFPEAPGSAHSGFLVSVPLAPGRYLTMLEAQCRDLGSDVFVASDLLVVRRRPAWRRVAGQIERRVGFLGFAAGKLRRRLAFGRGLPSWREIPAQMRRARQEFARRGHPGSALPPPEGFTPTKPSDPYDAWLADNRWGPRQEEDLRIRLRAATNLPKISVVTPVYRPDLEYFAETADSVRGQVYDNWEWCLADDASGDPGLTARLRDLAAQDGRIHFVTRSENGHISLATNSAAELASGDYIALMDHDDLLSPDCLAEVALHLAAHNDVDVLYTDDDKVDVDGRRYGPQFKPDWSPESLLSQMYFSHLFVVRRSLYEQVGGMRTGFEGSQDHDLALRVVEIARRVAHLPLVLYHWRAVPSSTAMSGDAKTYSFDAGIRAVAEALSRRGVPAEVDRPEWAVQAKASLLRHHFPDDGPRVAILVSTRNQLPLLVRCVESLARTRYRNVEIVILDDHSDDPETIAWLASFPGRVLRVPGPREGFNFSAIHNHAAHEVDAEYLLFLNNDTEVINPEWLSQLVGFARLPGVGAVGARLLFPDDTVQHAGILHGFNQGSLALAFRGLPREHPGYLAAARVCRNYGAVTAACLLTPRRLFLELGGFDEKDFAVSFNDVDYCYRLVDRGYRCVYAAEAELYHYEGATRGIGSRVDEIARFRQRYGHRPEPYYNPNLSTTSEHFEVRPRRLARRADRPVRALMASHTLDLTGAPFCQFELAAALHAKGQLDPIVISPEDGPLRSLYEECGIPVRILPHGMDKVGSLADYERELSVFTRQILDSNVEVVYGNTLKTFFAIDAARRLDLPSLWNVRESEPWQTYYSYLPDAVACRALECFGFPYRVIFVSNASRAVFEPLDSRHNFQVIHDGLDLDKWHARMGGWNRASSREKLSVGTEEIAVVLLGTVCERKGQHDLVMALAQLAPELANRLQCFIVGDRPGEYSRRMAGLLHQLPAAVSRRVHVVPETRDVACFYRAADVFVCTSRVESYPRVTLEAMACGLPIISTPVFGLSEQLVDQTNALLYLPGDAAALAAALARLAGDRALREGMGAQSRVVLAGLKSFEEMAEDYGVQFMEAREGMR